MNKILYGIILSMYALASSASIPKILTQIPDTISSVTPQYIQALEGNIRKINNLRARVEQQIEDEKKENAQNIENLVRLKSKPSLIKNLENAHEIALMQLYKTIILYDQWISHMQFIVNSHQEYLQMAENYKKLLQTCEK